MPARISHEAPDLHERKQARQHDRFADAPRRHGGEHENNGHHDRALRQIDELPDVAADPTVTAAEDTTPITTVNRPIAVASARDWNAALT